MGSWSAIARSADAEGRFSAAAQQMRALGVDTDLAAIGEARAALATNSPPMK